MSSGPKILIVDDEPAIRRFLKSSLEAQGFAVDQAETGRGALESARRTKPDLVVLDLGLPDIDGLNVIAEIRKFSPVPIIVLSVRNDETVKPFGMDELMARVRTALRHRLQEIGRGPVFRSGKLTVDFLRRIVSVDTAEVKLSKKEYEVLRLLAENAGKVMTHQQILSAVWGEAHRQDVEYLRVYVRQLRQKLQDDPLAPTLIQTEPGVGYRLIEAK
jgi:two-component system KDP operon response regulator KdpE